MKLTISKSLLEKIPLFNVSCYIFSTTTINDKNKLSNDITLEFEKLTKEYQEKIVNSIYVGIIKFLQIK